MTLCSWNEKTMGRNDCKPLQYRCNKPTQVVAPSMNRGLDNKRTSQNFTFFHFPVFSEFPVLYSLGSQPHIVLKNCDSHLCNHCMWAEFHSSKPDSKDLIGHKNFVVHPLTLQWLHYHCKEIRTSLRSTTRR